MRIPCSFLFQTLLVSNKNWKEREIHHLEKSKKRRDQVERPRLGFSNLLVIEGKELKREFNQAYQEAQEE